MGKIVLFQLVFTAILLIAFVSNPVLSKAIPHSENTGNGKSLLNVNPDSTLMDSPDSDNANTRVKRLFFNPYRHYPVVNYGGHGHHGGGHYGGHHGGGHHGGWGGGHYGGHHGGWGGGHYGGHGHGHGHGHHG